MTPPDYSGGSLVNLVAELEGRLIGSAPMPGLHPGLSHVIPAAGTYVVVLFDGLGDVQLDHPAAATLRAARRAVIDTVFPTTTTVALSSIATGLPPSQHGLLGYQLWLPEAEAVVNTIKWTTLGGDPVDYGYDRMLPAPNLWERLAVAGIEPITVQPGNFAGTPLTRVLYRGCRYEPVFAMEDFASATLDLAREPGRLIFVYLPNVDFAAHVWGQGATEYDDAVAAVRAVWEQITSRIPGDVVVIGTADHGHVDFPRSAHVLIPRKAHDHTTFYGDSRAMFVKGNGGDLARDLGLEWVPRQDMEEWWGPGPHHESFAGRAPDGVLLPPADRLLLHRSSDDRLIGNHGGLTDAERRVPLLVAG